MHSGSDIPPLSCIHQAYVEDVAIESPAGLQTTRYDGPEHAPEACNEDRDANSGLVSRLSVVLQSLRCPVHH
jgi:hypothetical protein